MKTKSTYLILVFLSIFSQLISQNFQIFGDAFPVPTVSNSTCLNADTCFSLTANVNWQNGAVWDLDTIDLSQPFDATFCMFIGANDNGADGFAFVLRDPGANVYGEDGGGLGYGSANGVGAISPSVAIEFDSYYNPDFFDIPEDHTALVINGIMNVAPAVPAVPLLPGGLNVEDNNFHNARIVWNPATLQISMYFDGFLRFNYTNDIINNVFGGNPKVLWGFTASTGGLSNLQQICFPKVLLDLPDYEICEQDSVLISYPVQNVQSYSWTGPSGEVILNWNDGMGVPLTQTSFYATESGTYTLTVNFNNATYSADAEVTLIPLPEQVSIDLCESSSNLNLFSLFTPGLETNGVWSGPSTLAGNHLGTFDPGTHSEGVYVYTLSSSGVCPSDNQVTVNYYKVQFNPEINVIPCTETAYEIEISPLMSNGQSNFSYTWSWSNTDVTVTTNQNQAEILMNSNTTVVIDVVSNNAFACKFDTTINLVFQANPTFDLGQDIYICTGNTIEIIAVGSWNTYLWNDNSTNSSIDVNVSGEYWVEVSTDQNCTFSDTIQVFITDVPEISLFSFDTISCLPFNLSFEAGVSVPQAILSWNFGDGTSITNTLNPNHTYTSPGVYDITLKASLGANCQVTLFLEDAIHVLNRPVANFLYSLIENTGNELTVEFYNNSSFYSNLVWDFNSIDTSTAENPVMSFNTTGASSFTINLRASNDYCFDEYTQLIKLPEQLIYYVPNTFTPDGNYFNNVFEPIFTEGIEEDSYHLSIYNRWGEIIFESYNSKVGWDGSYGFKIAKEGVYAWTIEFVEKESKEKRLITGFVNLMK
jgi:gliding motility-associated-like protein